jgi:aryl-alcohol dehydrogenase-like predicted oxidoreductase
MNTRPLGRSGLHIAPLVFGSNVFGWTADEARSFALLDRFVERGFNAIDTADVYAAWAPGLAGGESETIIGRWLARRGRRDDVIVMTKVAKWQPRKGLSAANIEAAVEDSLRRLRSDHIDVYFAHEDDASVPLEETLAAFDRLVRAGKVRALGASNYGPERVLEALRIAAREGLARYEVLQPGYNLLDRGFETTLAPVAREQGLGVVAYFALASGFLTGKYRRIEDLEGSSRAGFLRHCFDARGLRVLASLREVAEELAATPAQVALAWLMAKPAVSAPIASATSLAQLDDLMAAAELVLPAEATSRLDNAASA